MIMDASHYQGNIDWSQAKRDLDFVILRASVGSNMDKKYHSYADECEKNSIPYGTYHYVKATTIEEAKKEAKWFHKLASEKKPLFYVADIEYEPTIEAGYDEIGEAFLKQLKELGVKKTGLYIAQRYYPNCTKCQKIIDFNWIPRYGIDNGKYDPQYNPTCYADLHQYTSRGFIKGTDGRVDLNRISGNKTVEWFITEQKEENKMAYLMTAQELIDKAVDIAKNYKTIYMYAAYGFQVTDKTIAGKAQQNLEGWYNSSNLRKLRAVANQNPPTWGFDCVNLYKAIFWGWTGDVTKEKGGAKYGTNGVPDTNANGLFNRCLNKSSDFSTIKPGEAVWIPGHFGLYIGNNLVVECTPSWDDGVQITGLLNVEKVAGRNNRKWDKHGFLPYVDYQGDEKVEVPEVHLGSRTLKKGMEGQDVKELQEALIQLGYDLGSYGADGDFGSITEKRVKDFQKSVGLKTDGIVGADTVKALEAKLDNGGEEIPTEPDTPVVPEVPPVVAPNYEVTGGSVYLWNDHPAYGGEKGIIVRKNDKLDKPDFGTYVPIVHNGSIKWINSKYVK